MFKLSDEKMKGIVGGEISYFDPITGMYIDPDPHRNTGGFQSTAAPAEPSGRSRFREKEIEEILRFHSHFW